MNDRYVGRPRWSGRRVLVLLVFALMLNCRGEEVMRVPSPDGRWAAVVMSLPCLDPPTQVVELEDLGSGERSELMRPGPDSEWVDRIDWSADGRQVSFLIAGRRAVTFDAGSHRRISEDPLIVSPSEDAHLSGADLADGVLAVSWQDTEAAWSEIVVSRDGGRVGRLELVGDRVQGVRWTRPGVQFLAWVIGDEGGETRLYQVGGDGELTLEWTSLPLEGRYDSVVLSPDGSRWLGNDLTEREARVAVGRVGEDEPFQTCRLDAAAVGAAEPMAAAEFSDAMFLDVMFRQDRAPGGRGSEPGAVGVLWGGRLWLGRVGGELRELRPPAGTERVQVVTPTAAGLWLELYRPGDARRHFTWGLYPPSAVDSAGEPSRVESFHGPRFLPDGRVVDVDLHGGGAKVYAVAADGASLTGLGSLDVPVGTRAVSCGEALCLDLGDTGDGRETFRVVPVATVR